MKKVLHAIQTADPAGGGPIEGILQVARATQASVQHSVLCLDCPDAPYLADFPLPNFPLGPGGILGYSPRLLPWLQEHASEYQAIIVHGLWRYISFGCWRALHRSDVPYFAFPHGMLDPWFKQRYPMKHLKKLLFWRWTEYRLLRDANAVIFTCEDEKLRARKSFSLYRANEEVAMLGIHRPPEDPVRQSRAFFQAYPELQGKRLLLYLSRIHPKKGCDLLIEAFAKLANRDEALRLVMAGPDQTGWSTQLRELASQNGISERVTWTGMLSGDVKWGAYRAASAFILPTHQENFGIVVAEALACGTPVLISDQVQIWREIEMAGACFVEPDNLAGTQRLIERWLATDNHDWLAMKRRALMCFEDNFEISGYARRFVDLIDKYSARSNAQPGAAA